MADTSVTLESSRTHPIIFELENIQVVLFESSLNILQIQESTLNIVDIHESSLNIELHNKIENTVLVYEVYSDNIVIITIR